jgi:hypothetical protein
MQNATERFFDDFLGANVVVATATAPAVWAKADTSANGAPTLCGVTGMTSAVRMLLDNTNEAQILSLYWGDVCGIKVNDLRTVTFRLKTATNITTAQTLTFGMTSARADNTDNTTYNAQFKLAASTAILVETDDGSTDDDDNDTGVTLSTSYKEFVIDFSNGISDVRFFVTDAGGDLRRVLGTTTFSLAGATGQYLQPNIQLEKSGGATTPSVDIDYVEILYKRS